MKKSIVSVAVVFIAGIVFGQGSLIPVSAPSTTMKTLQQVESRIDISTLSGGSGWQYRIDTPGSYYLTSNLNITNVYGIYVNITNVTIDLNGYSVFTLYPVGVGIGVLEGASGLTVKNGTITGFLIGINYYLDTKPAIGGVLKDLSVSHCSSVAMYIGTSSKIMDCVIYDNPGAGLYASRGSVVSGCTFYGNKGNYTFTASTGSKVFNCTAYSNIADNVFYALNGVSISDCDIFRNKAQSAIKTGSGCKVVDCNIYDNEVTYGINVSYNSAIERCVVSYNDGGATSSYGIYASPGSSVTDCTVGNQISTNTPSLSTYGAGIYASAATVKDCTVSYNSGDGIIVVTDCYVEGNQCRANGRNEGDGAGIHATGSGNRIDNNHLASNDRGLDIDNIDNLLLRNSAHGNTLNYDAVLGTVAGVSTNSITAGPWDNFEF